MQEGKSSKTLFQSEKHKQGKHQQQFAFWKTCEFWNLFVREQNVTGRHFEKQD